MTLKQAQAGFIGLGAMGGGIARRLANAGVKLHVQLHAAMLGVHPQRPCHARQGVEHRTIHRGEIRQCLRLATLQLGPGELG